MCADATSTAACCLPSPPLALPSLAVSLRSLRANNTDALGRCHERSTSLQVSSTARTARTVRPLTSVSRWTSDRGTVAARVRVCCGRRTVARARYCFCRDRLPSFPPSFRSIKHRQSIRRAAPAIVLSGLDACPVGAYRYAARRTQLTSAISARLKLHATSSRCPVALYQRSQPSIGGQGAQGMRSCRRQR